MQHTASAFRLRHTCPAHYSGADIEHGMHSTGAHLDHSSSDADIDLASTTGKQAGSMLGWAEGTRDVVADDLTLTGRSASSRTIRQRKVGRSGSFSTAYCSWMLLPITCCKKATLRV